MLCRVLSTVPEQPGEDAMLGVVPDDATDVLPADRGAVAEVPSGRDADPDRDAADGACCRHVREREAPCRGASCCPVADVRGLRADGYCRIQSLIPDGYDRWDAFLDCHDFRRCFRGLCRGHGFRSSDYYCCRGAFLDCCCHEDGCCRGVRHDPCRDFRCCFLPDGSCRKASCLVKATRHCYDCLRCCLNGRVRAVRCGCHHRVPSDAVHPFRADRWRAWCIECRLRCCGIAVSCLL